MAYSSLRFVDALGGIEAVVADGHTAYFVPGSDLHAEALAGAFGPVSPYMPAAGPTPEELLDAERARMSVFRLAWEDAAAVLSYGPGTLLDAIDALLASLPPVMARRYRNITIFERTRPEIVGFLMSPEAINLPPAAVDALFRLGMAIEARRPPDELDAHAAAWQAALA